jgi:23S rRNA pseudouridine2604 synthase
MSRPSRWCNRKIAGRTTTRAFSFTPVSSRAWCPPGGLTLTPLALLVLTQDGRVARQLIGEDSLMEKEYLVRVIYTGVINTAAASSAAATHAARPVARATPNRPAPPTQLSRIDDDDPVSQDVQSVFPPEQLALLRHGLRLDGQPLKPAQGRMAKPRAAAFCVDRGQEAPDSPHVRTGRPEGGRSQTRARWPGDAGQPAAGPMALPGAA